MSIFRYKAVRPTGEPVEGQLEAANRQGAVSQLADMGYVPVRVDQAGGTSFSSILSMDLFGGGSGRTSPRDIMIATREIATLLDAGVELERALGIVVAGLIPVVVLSRIITATRQTRAGGQAEDEGW